MTIIGLFKAALFVGAVPGGGVEAQHKIPEPMSRVFGGQDGRQMRGAQPGQLGQRRLVETAFCHVRRIWFPANLPEFSTPAEVPSGVLTQDVSFLGYQGKPLARQSKCRSLGLRMVCPMGRSMRRFGAAITNTSHRAYRSDIRRSRLMWFARCCRLWG
jgi:hypothetical protein